MITLTLTLPQAEALKRALYWATCYHQTPQEKRAWDELRDHIDVALGKKGELDAPASTT